FYWVTGSNYAMSPFKSMINRSLGRWSLAAIWLLTAACSGVAMAADAPPIPAHEARYEVLRHGKKIGELTVSLEQLDNGVWHYRSDTQATAWWVKALNVSAEEAAHF